MKHDLFVACVILFASAFSPVEAQPDQAIDAVAASPSAVDSVFTTDLDFDLPFGGDDTGEGAYDFNSDNFNHDEGLRTFYRCEAFSGTACTQPYYYAVGRHRSGSGWNAIVAKVDMFGQQDFGFGIQGHLTVSTPMTDIGDVAFDAATGRLYFAGGAYGGSFPREAFAVFCVDVLSGAACSDWNFSVFHFLLSIDGDIDSVATRIVLDPAGFLYVGGIAQADDGFQLAVRKISTTTGNGDESFGNTGSVSYALHMDGFPPSPGQDARVFDMALSAASAPQGHQLYLVGSNKQQGGSDYHGYVVWLEPHTGAWLKSHDMLGSAATAVSVLANADLAIGGYSNTATASAPSLLLAKFHAADSSLDLNAGFCGAGLCLHDVGAGIHGWRNTLPSAIAERPGNRDLVVGMQAGVWTYNFSTDTWHLNQKQVVQQYGASGSTLHATQTMDFPAASDTTPTAYSAGMLVDNASVLLTGSRLWGVSNDDFDITVTRLLANDSIFADQFGGPHSD